MIRISAQLSKLRTLTGVLFTLLLTFIGLTAITFVIGRVMPADPVLAVVGDRASQEVYEQVYQEMGLDRPLYVQYWHFLLNALQGDFGVSLRSRQPALDTVLSALPQATRSRLPSSWSGRRQWRRRNPPKRIGTSN